MEYIKRKNYICILLIIIFIFSCNNKNNENNISKLKKLLQDVSYLEIVDVIYEHFLNKTVIINISIFDNFDKKQEAINTGNIWIDHNSLVAIYKKQLFGIIIIILFVAMEFIHGNQEKKRSFIQENGWRYIGNLKIFN